MGLAEVQFMDELTGETAKILTVWWQDATVFQEGHIVYKLYMIVIWIHHWGLAD